MRRFGIGLAAFVLLGTAACGGSPEEPGDTLTGPGDAHSTTDTGSATVQADGFSFRGSIEALPRPTDDSYPIAVGDLAAGAEALGLDAPETPEEKRDWLTALGVSRRDSAVTFLLPRNLSSELGAAKEAELGWDITQVSSWAEVGHLPEAQVMTGDFDESSLSPDLVDLGNGVLSAGEGEDGSVDPETRTPLRPLGRPLRVGQDGGQVILSSNTRTVQNWLAGQGPTVGEDETVLEVADQLDAVGAVSGFFLVQPGGGAGVESLLGANGSAEEAQQLLEEMEQWSITQPFGVVAVGTTLEGSTAQDVVVYHFGSDSAATSAVEQVERAWTNGLLQRGTPVAEMFALAEARAEGSTVVVLLDRAEASSDVLSGMLVARDGPLNYL